jgi:hypothetical protein
MRSRPAQSGSRGRKSKGGDRNSKQSQFQLNVFQKRALAKLYMVGVRKVMGEAEEAGEEMTNERLTEFGDVTATMLDINDDAFQMIKRGLERADVENRASCPIAVRSRRAQGG